MFADALTSTERRWFKIADPYADVDVLLARARAAWERLSPDQQAHHRHEQKISFVTGNLAIDSPLPVEELRLNVIRAAGPCPCGGCLAASRTRTREIRPELAEALAEACRG